MRFLVEFSKMPKSYSSSFWDDVSNTEHWLQTLNKDVGQRQLELTTQSPRLLTPWIFEQRQPVHMEGWLYPMEAGLTWQYLTGFLSANGPDYLLIPLGTNGGITWSTDRIVIRAPRQSWVWLWVEEIWDPASWQPVEELEWWFEGRLYRAYNLGDVIVEERVAGPGMEEWVVTRGIPGADLLRWWSQLVWKLGSHSVRVGWRDEFFSLEQRLLGLPVQHVKARLRLTGNYGYLTQSHEWPPPKGLKAQFEWDIPTWDSHWNVHLVLNKWKHASRLEAKYQLQSSDNTAAFRHLRHQQKSLPIFRLQPIMDIERPREWSRLKEVSLQYHQLEALQRNLTQYPWPEQILESPRRIRLAPEWKPVWSESEPGKWTFVHQHSQLRLQISWPKYAYAGDITMHFDKTYSFGLDAIDPLHRINRGSTDWRYWALVAKDWVMPAVSRWWESTAH